MRRSTFLITLFAATPLLVGCGDEAPERTDEGTVVHGTVNVDGGVELSDDAKAKLMKRLAGMRDKANRTPGMPQLDGEGGDRKVDLEALRRAMNVAQRPVTEDEMKAFFAISRESRANPSAYTQLLKKHSLSAIRFGMIGSLFARHSVAKTKGGLSAEETALVERWLDEWKSLTKGN